MVKVFGSIVFAVLAVAPGVSFAYLSANYSSFDALSCRDGTVFVCMEFDVQIPCPNTFNVTRHCDGHGGTAGFAPVDGKDATKVQIGDYRGALPLPRYTGDLAVTVLVTATADVTCVDGNTFTCDEAKTSCSLERLDAQCGSAGAKQIESYFAFTPFRVR